MRQLAERVLWPLAAPGAPGAWYRGLRVMALDGSCMDVADEVIAARRSTTSISRRRRFVSEQYWA